MTIDKMFRIPIAWLPLIICTLILPRYTHGQNARPFVIKEGDGADVVKNANKAILNKWKTREYDFLARVCDLSAEQLKQAKDTDGDHFDKALVDKALKPIVGAFIRAGNHAPLNRSVIQKYRQGLQEEFSKLLTPEQRSRYEDELKAREEFRRRANAECLVTLLDQKLSLNAEQLEPLKEALAGWEGAEDLQLSFYFQSGSDLYMPPIPKELYSKVLTPGQMQLIKTFQNVMVQRQDANDELNP